MRFLIDQGIGRDAATMLRQVGVDAIHVGDLGIERASDEAILRLAEEEERVVVTLDGDYHRILARDEMSGPSVILFRIQRLGDEEAAERTLALADFFADALAEGVAISSTRTNTRVRRLPFSR